MAKGIYQIVNTHSHSVLRVVATEDIERDLAGFADFIEDDNELKRYKYKSSLAINVLEETDNLAERYAYYVWPELSRVTYSKECMQKSIENDFSQRIQNVVDWLIGTFIDFRYTFNIYLLDERIAADVYEDGKRIEIYTFKKKSGEPYSRSFIN